LAIRPLATFRCKRRPISLADRVPSLRQRRQIVWFSLDAEAMAGVKS